jgi:serine protease Do
MGLDYEDFLQTDAAINPGNSGGALVDVDGRLVGINTAILSRSGGNQGIGFAIPSNLARYVMESLVKDGRVARGYMGVQIQNITPELAKQFDAKAKNGALVGDVVDHSPADKAGLKNGDIIVEFNGKPVNDSRQLKLAVAQTPPGTKAPIKILRDGSTKSLQVTLTELPGEEKLAQNSSKDSKDTGTLNGVEVSDINNQVRRELNLPETAKGAVVTEVAPDSAASEAGLQPGDVILEINRHPITNAEDAVRLTENPKDKTSLLRIWRNGGRHYIVVDESKAG